MDFCVCTVELLTFWAANQTRAAVRSWALVQVLVPFVCSSPERHRMPPQILHLPCTDHFKSNCRVVDLFLCVCVHPIPVPLISL